MALRPCNDPPPPDPLLVNLGDACEKLCRELHAALQKSHQEQVALITAFQEVQTAGLGPLSPVLSSGNGTSRTAVTPIVVNGEKARPTSPSIPGQVEFAEVPGDLKLRYSTTLEGGQGLAVTPDTNDRPSKEADEDSDHEPGHHTRKKDIGGFVWDAGGAGLPSVVAKQTAVVDFVESIKESTAWPHLARVAMGTAKEPPRTGCLAQVVSSKLFSNTISFIILVNLPVMWWNAEYQLRNRSSSLPSHLVILEWIFLTIYIVELALKLAVHRFYFFVTPDWPFNLLDFFIVTTSILSQLLDTVNPSYLRALRVMKLGKVLRVLRVLSIFPSLRLMVDCIAHSFHVLLWCILMIAFMIFMFSMVFVQGTVDYLEDAIDLESIPSEVMDDFGSVPDAMHSLFKAVTGGDDWSMFYDTIAHFGLIYKGAFLFYIVFNTIVVWNVVTSLFVDQAMTLAQPDMETLVYEKSVKEKKDVEELVHLLASHFDTNGNRKLNLAEFTEALQDAKIRAFFEMRGLDIKYTHLFFDMLASHTGSGHEEVDLDSFAASCLRMKGPASSVDLHTLIVRQNQKMREVFREELMRTGKRKTSYIFPTGIQSPTVVSTRQGSRQPTKNSSA